MSEFAPVSELADVWMLDEHEVALGYRCGLANNPAPGSWASRAFWHGWRSGRVDGGHAESDPVQEVLAYRWQAAMGFNGPVVWH